MSREIEIVTRDERVVAIRSELHSMVLRRRKLEAELSEIVLGKLGIAPGIVVEEKFTGLRYVVESGSMSGSSDWPLLVCRRVYKSGRRAGMTAASHTYLHYRPSSHEIVGTLQDVRSQAYSSES